MGAVLTAITQSWLLTWSTVKSWFWAGIIHLRCRCCSMKSNKVICAIEKAERQVDYLLAAKSGAQGQA